MTKHETRGMFYTFQDKFQDKFSHYKDADEYIEYIELMDDFRKPNHPQSCEVNDAEDLVSSWNWLKDGKIYLMANKNQHMGPEIEWFTKILKTDKVVLCVAKVIAVESFVADFIFTRESPDEPWERQKPDSQAYKDIAEELKVMETLKQ